jgi:hypothetical protein
MLSITVWVSLPFENPPLNVRRKITVLGLIKSPLTAAGTVKLIAGCIPVGIVAVPKFVKVAPPSRLYEAVTVLKPFPLLLNPKLNDIFA